MFFDEFFGMGNQATIVVALVSLMGVSVSIAVAMAMAINYLDEPIATKRQIVLTAVIVLLGFYAVIAWPEDESAEPAKMTLSNHVLVPMVSNTTPKQDI